MTDFTIPIILLFLFLCGLKFDIMRMKKQIKVNDLNEENQRLKEALLFFVDVSNSECSSNWRKDMENDCQRLFNCSYEEAKEKYGDYDSTYE